MSDAKKNNIEVSDLDFFDISGGVEEKVQEPVKEELFQVGDVPKELAPNAVSETNLKSSYHLPVPTPDGGWKLVDIINISGEDFLLWAESVYPPMKTSKITPESMEGPKNLLTRKQVVNDIAEWGKRAQQYGRKIDTDKILQ